MKFWFWLLLLVAGTACAPAPVGPIDPAIASALAATKAIDNHAHPVRPTAAGEAPDMGFDALPVESLEPWSDPVRFRPGRSEYAEANKALFAGDRAAAAKSWGANYAATVLDKAGIDKMIANRVAMGEGLPKERFLWAAYADALMYPFPTEGITANSDRKAFFELEKKLLGEYYKQSGVAAASASLDQYLQKVVTATLERHKQGGALAEKFEMAYLRPLAIGNPSKTDAERAWKTSAASPSDYRTLQDFLFRYIALECGRLGLVIHIHTGMGAGGYYDGAGANPALLEPLFNDPSLRKTNFVMVHGGWPNARLVTPLLTKPNAYVDFSAQGLILPVSDIAESLQSWLEMVPEKVLFGTDAYPFAPAANLGWEETAYVSSQAGRKALGMALTAMLRDGSVTRERAIEIGKLVLRGNAARLYGLQ
ncbi:MAG: amidohydrolase family protein [Bryobacteraceae bacterium]